MIACKDRSNFLNETYCHKGGVFVNKKLISELSAFITFILMVCAMFMLYRYSGRNGFPLSTQTSIVNFLILIPSYSLMILSAGIKKVVVKFIVKRKLDESWCFILTQIYIFIFIILFNHNSQFMKLIDNIIKKYC